MGKQSTDIKAGFPIGRKHMACFESFANMLRIVKLYTDPISVVYLCCLVGRSATPKGIQDNVSRIGGNQNGTLRDNQLQFVDSGTDLEFPMPVWRSIFPKIGEIYTFRVHFTTVSAVVS